MDLSELFCQFEVDSFNATGAAEEGFFPSYWTFFPAFFEWDVPDSIVVGGEA